MSEFKTLYYTVVSLSFQNFSIVFNKVFNFNEMFITTISNKINCYLYEISTLYYTTTSEVNYNYCFLNNILLYIVIALIKKLLGKY